LKTAGGVRAVLARDLGQQAQVLDARIVLHDGAGVHDVAAVRRHFPDDAPTEGAHILRLAKTEQRVGHAAAEGELVVRLPRPLTLRLRHAQVVVHDHVSGPLIERERFAFTRDQDVVRDHRRSKSTARNSASRGGQDCGNQRFH
jgi:hypothetical protein